MRCPKNSRQANRKENTPAPPKPKVDASTKNILSKMLRSEKTEGKVSGGEGDDRVAGDKGKIEGIPMQVAITVALDLEAMVRAMV